MKLLGILRFILAAYLLCATVAGTIKTKDWVMMTVIVHIVMTPLMLTYVFYHIAEGLHECNITNRRPGKALRVFVIVFALIVIFFMILLIPEVKWMPEKMLLWVLSAFIVLLVPVLLISDIIKLWRFHRQ